MSEPIVESAKLPNTSKAFLNSKLIQEQHKLHQFLPLLQNYSKCKSFSMLSLLTSSEQLDWKVALNK